MMSWLDRINPQLNIAWSGSWPAPGYVEPARKIYDHELVLFTSGECRVTVEDREYRCPAGTFMIIPPDEVHVSSSVSQERVHRYCFHFDWIYVPRRQPLPYCVFLPGRFKRSGVRAAPQWIRNRLWHGKVSNLAAASHLAKKIHALWNSSDSPVRAVCRAQLLELLLQLLSPSHKTPLPDCGAELADRVRQLLDSRANSQTSIQTLLEELDYSYAHLCRTFTRQFGTSPLSYVNARRLESAKEFMTRGNRSIKQVANLAGFTDPAYFSRLFRKTVGVSPRTFSRTHRKVPSQDAAATHLALKS